MTKEEKLIELGYKISAKYKAYKVTSYCVMNIDIQYNRRFLDNFATVSTQKELDEIQICLNNLKRDYEEVMKLED